ncbi:unnamed protein product [Camellia sinensis]
MCIPNSLILKEAKTNPKGYIVGGKPDTLLQLAAGTHLVWGIEPGLCALPTQPKQRSNHWGNLPHQQF